MLGKLWVTYAAALRMSAGSRWTRSAVQVYYTLKGIDTKYTEAVQKCKSQKPWCYLEKFPWALTGCRYTLNACFGLTGTFPSVWRVVFLPGNENYVPGGELLNGRHEKQDPQMHPHTPLCPALCGRVMSVDFTWHLTLWSLINNNVRDKRALSDMTLCGSSLDLQVWSFTSFFK